MLNFPGIAFSVSLFCIHKIHFPILSRPLMFADKEPLYVDRILCVKEKRKGTNENAITALLRVEFMHFLIQFCFFLGLLMGCDLLRFWTFVMIHFTDFEIAQMAIRSVAVKSDRTKVI